VPVKVEVPGNLSGKVPRSKKRRKLKRGLVYIPGVDYHTHDMPHVLSSFSENIWIFSKYFRDLKALNYPLKSLTCDDKQSEIIGSCLRYYPQAKIQLCLTHYSREIRRKLKVQNIVRSIKSLEKKLAGLGADLRLPYYARRYSFKRAVKLLNQIAHLESQHQIVIDFQGLMLAIIFSKSLKTKDRRLDELENIFFRDWFKEGLLTRTQRKRISKVYSSFLEDEKFLFTHLRHPKLRIPTTTNLLEGMNGHIEDRLTHIRGFESRQTADNYLNALVLRRRFKKLTSCRGKFSHLNGKAPIEHAGIDISKIKNWVRFCSNTNT
jgi:hypothetical protein